jgi:putative ABC transport system substrate-binding protein
LQIPAIYPRREQVVAGGLVSYATDPLDSSRVAGTYVGRILKGEKPGDLSAITRRLSSSWKPVS